MKTLNKIFPFKTAYMVFIAISCVALVYHILIVTQIISYANAWGGRLTSVHAMYLFETFSIISQLFFILVGILKFKQGVGKRLQTILSFLLYIMSGLLALNTIGNILSLRSFEAIAFTPITLLGSICAFRLARE